MKLCWNCAFLSLHSQTLENMFILVNLFSHLWITTQPSSVCLLRLKLHSCLFLGTSLSSHFTGPLLRMWCCWIFPGILDFVTLHLPWLYVPIIRPFLLSHFCGLYTLSSLYMLILLIMISFTLFSSASYAFNELSVNLPTLIPTIYQWFPNFYL